MELSHRAYRISVAIVATLFIAIGLILIADCFLYFGAGLYNVTWGGVSDVAGVPLGTVITFGIGVIFSSAGTGILYDIMVARIVLLLIAGCYAVFGMFLIVISISRYMAEIAPWLRAGIVGSAMLLKAAFTFWVLYWVPYVTNYGQIE